MKPYCRLLLNINGSNITIMETIPISYQTSVELSGLRDDPYYTKYYTFLTRFVQIQLIRAMGEP